MLRDVVLAGIAVAGFAGLVFLLAGEATRRRERPRVTLYAPPEEWLTLREAADELELPVEEVIELTERDAIPYWVHGGHDPADPERLRFRRDEFDQWMVG